MATGTIRADIWKMYLEDNRERIRKAGYTFEEMAWLTQAEALAGIPMKVREQYGDRVFLAYPEPEIKKTAGRVVGIDLPAKYVIITE
jgi:hypothetical protein